MAKLTKFPVTMSDGMEYRVTITEHDEELTSNALARVRIYVERKGRRLFRFKRLVTYDFYDGEGTYNPISPDYIALAHAAIESYKVFIVWRADYKGKVMREEAEKERNRSRAIRAFTEWDGKINDGGDSQ